MVRPSEPFYGVISRPVAPFGVIRHFAYIIMLPGALWTLIGMVSLNVGWIAGGLTLVATLMAPASWFCRKNPYFFADAIDAMGQTRYFVPDSGLRGKDGV